MPKNNGQATASGKRAELAVHLNAKRSTIDDLVRKAITQMRFDRDEPEQGDIETQDAVAGLIDYVFASLLAGSGRGQPLPLTVIEGARSAARANKTLDAVLRSLSAGDRSLRRVLAEELQRFDSSVADDAYALIGAAVDAVMKGAAEEFDAESTRLSTTADPLLLSVNGCLKEEADMAEISDYILDRWHVGLVSKSSVARPSVVRLAQVLGGSPLAVVSTSGQCWIWIGKNEPLPAAKVAASVADIFDSRNPFGLGEPRHGRTGWRLTHSEALAALESPAAVGRQITRMRNHLLETAVLKDKVSRESLATSYIEPLKCEPTRLDLAETILAYLSLGQNAISAAHSLGIDRHTVQRRIRKVESLIGENIEECSAQLHIALKVAKLE